MIIFGMIALAIVFFVDGFSSFRDSLGVTGNFFLIYSVFVSVLFSISAFRFIVGLMVVLAIVAGLSVVVASLVILVYFVILTASA